MPGAGLLRDGGKRMSAACGCDEPETTVGEAVEEVQERPWWRDRGIMVPVLSGAVSYTHLTLPTM